MDPESVWSALSDVERTSLLVAFLRWHGSKHYQWQSGPHKGQPLYSDPYGQLWVNYCIPMQQQQLLMQQSVNDRLPDLLAVRTAELDSQIAAALADNSSIQQMVILGAGTDTRAWRLQFPEGFAVYEVDSEAVLGFKSRVMTEAVSAAQQQQQQQHVPGLQCDKRVEVAADASEPQELWSKLLGAGLNAVTPTLYLLEGFIGYLTVDASNALLSHIHHETAAGSRIIITAAPPPEDRARSAAAAAVVEDGNNGTTVAAHGSSSSSGGGSNAAVPPMKLFHSTFEEPTSTLQRLQAAGWSNCQLLTKDHLTAKYGVDHAQPIMIGHKQ